MPQYSGPERLKSVSTSFRRVESLTNSTATLTTDDADKLFLLNRAGGIAVALPAIGSDDIGLTLAFYVQTAASGGSYVITAQAGDLLIGKVRSVDTDTSNADAYYAPDGSDDLICTLNASTMGGGVGGDYLEFVAISATRWLVRGEVFITGNAATMFS